MRVAALFNSRARKWIAGRRVDLEQTIQFPARVPRRVWFHAASLGEFEQAKPVIEAWKIACPTDLILLSFFSSSGLENASANELADAVFYLPVDLPQPIHRALDFLQPDLFILVKYDFWPQLMRSLQRRKVPTVLISGLFRENHYLFRWWTRPVLKLLNSFLVLFVQDEVSAQCLQKRGLNPVVVAGDTRVDRVFDILEAEDGHVADLGSYQVIIGGSTYAAEEEMLAAFWQSERFTGHKDQWKLVLAPHDLSELHLQKVEALYGDEVLRLSNWKEWKKTFSVLLVDRVGMLSRLYRYATIAVIGGGFGKGIHNVLEPAVHGVSILFGPRWKKFREASGLIAEGAAYEFQGEIQLSEELIRQISDPKLAKKRGDGALNWLNRNRGATSLIIKELMERI